MLEETITCHNVSVAHSFMIGDSDWDVKSENKFGLKANRIKANSNLNEFILFNDKS